MVATATTHWPSSAAPTTIRRCLLFTLGGGYDSLAPLAAARRYPCVTRLSPPVVAGERGVGGDGSLTVVVCHRRGQRAAAPLQICHCVAADCGYAARMRASAPARRAGGGWPDPPPAPPAGPIEQRHQGRGLFRCCWPAARRHILVPGSLSATSCCLDLPVAPRLGLTAA